MITVETPLPIPYTGDFIAAAVRMDSANPENAQHAGLVIKYGEIYKVFHFGPTIELDDVDGSWHFLKSLRIVNPKLAGSIYNMFLKIQGQPNPRYGMMFDGSYWDINGDYFSDSELPAYTTCVGFCMSVIKGILYAKDFIQYSDWTDTDNFGIDRMPDPQFWINRILAENSGLTEEDVKPFIKRVLPIEYFTAAQSDSTPVRKSYIDANKSIVLSNLT